MYFKNRRTKRILIGSSSLIASMGLTLAVGLILAGMLARYFTPKEFGLWSILISLNGMFLSGFDFGFGNALRNRMTQLYAGGRDKESKTYFFCIFYWFTCIAFLLSISFLCVSHLIPWDIVFSSRDPVLLESGASLMTLGACILAFNIAFNVYTAGFFSYQESHWNALLSVISKLIFLLVTVLLVLTLKSFFAINLMMLFITLLSSIMAFVVFLVVRNWGFILVPIRAGLSKVKEIWVKSAQFACLQIFSIILLLGDLFIVSKIIGLETVGEYFLVKRIYLVLAGFHFAVLLPIWSAYTESIESGDVRWAETILGKAVICTVIVFALGVAIMYFSGRDIVYWWTGKEIRNTSLFIWLGVWGFIYGWSNCFSVFLNATGSLKYQVILGGGAAAAFIPLSLSWGGHHGVVGVCMSLVAVSLPFAIFAPIESVSILNRLHRARG